MIARSSDYKINNTIFRVAYGDITKTAADVLVSSDDGYLSMSGGVSAALLRVGGDAVWNDTRKHVPLGLGDVAVTSAGVLSSKYIFHAVTIDRSTLARANEASIRRAVKKCMSLANALGVRTLAFPALGTGVAGFPFELAAEVMTRTIADYLTRDTDIELVALTLYPRAGVDETRMNMFYERVTGLASISGQSKVLDKLLAELEEAIVQGGKPQLVNKIVELRADLSQAQIALNQESVIPDDYSRRERAIANVGSVVAAVTSVEIETWDSRELESEILRTKYSGLLTQLNIQTQQLSKYEIEKAKYGGIGIPPRLENAIDDLKREQERLEELIRDVRQTLAKSSMQ